MHFFFRGIFQKQASERRVYVVWSFDEFLIEMFCFGIFSEHLYILTFDDFCAWNARSHSSEELILCFYLFCLLKLNNQILLSKNILNLTTSIKLIL